MKLKIASRKSDLARWQSVQVARLLKNRGVAGEVEFIFKSSLGDQNLDVPLASMGGRGVFTEDFQQDLTGGTCDMVVHSWKDLPVEERAETQIAMTLRRADPRDLLLVPRSVWENSLRKGVLEVLTSSPRRIYNLQSALGPLLPANVQVKFLEVRGNVPTRLSKMRDQGRALLLAKAGLDRLLEAEKENFIEAGFSLRAIVDGCRFMVLPLSLNPPAAAQGALAVEVLRARRDLTVPLNQASDASTETCARLEREILKGYGGGCHQKIGVAVLERPYGRVFSLRGLTDAGQILRDWRIESSTAWSRAASVDAVFPRRAADNSWFERRRLSADARMASKNAVLVARFEAWDQAAKPADGAIVWTAGLKTWTKLAAQGVWVNGSFDGLGEDEDPALESLCANPLDWAKLSHDRSEAAGRALCATYRLEPKAAERSPDLTGKTHFFWMSATSFERARELFPREIEQGFHACGPGSTFKALTQARGLKNSPKVFIDLDQFLRETLA